MKTSKTKGLKAFAIKALMLSVLVLSVSCGENNTSGKSKNRSNGSWGASGTGGWGNYGGGTYYGGNGQQLPNNWLDIVAQENPCRTNSGGQNRQQIQVSPQSLPQQSHVNAGALHVGVTSEGDIAILSNEGNGTVMSLFICPRPGMTGQGQFFEAPVANIQQSCSVGEISNGDIGLMGPAGYYRLAFRPIYYPNGSQLCSY